MGAGRDGWVKVLVAEEKWIQGYGVTLDEVEEDVRREHQIVAVLDSQWSEPEVMSHGN